MKKEIRGLLPHVSKPGRYIGGEVNSIKKELNSVSIKVALAFPETYEIGISNLGLQILYHILNEKEEIAAERVYAPWGDMEQLMRESDLPLCSLESSLPLSDFDIVGFSLQHELTYTNLLNMLDLGGIPLLASGRGDEAPLVIAGGPSAFNPEPSADFIDAFLLGDGEEGLLEICGVYSAWKKEGRKRGDLLVALSEIEGVYVPSLFAYEYLEDGGVKKITSHTRAYEKVKRRILSNVDDAPYPTSFVIPNVKPVHDRIPLEVARGCSRFCRFCQAGYVYLPVRERSPEKIRELGDRALRETGHDEVALLSLSTGDYSCLEGLLPDLSNRYKASNINLSFPSLRVDSITPPIMDEMKKLRQRGFTIAPEAGSQRLRDLINKGVTEEQILDCVRDISKAGGQSVKLYFMIGLPSETIEDMEEIVRLSNAILKAGRKVGGLRRITVNISNFVPKPHTPFQWEKQDSAEETREKLKYFKGRLRDRSISLKWQEPEMSILEGVFSRGDRRLGGAILKAFEMGCRFDSWGEMLDFPSWQEACKESSVNMEYYLRKRECDDVLPWDTIDVGVDKAFLLKELRKSSEGEYTPDCRYEKCSDCGVCDHKTVKNRIFDGESLPSSPLTGKVYTPLKTRLRVRYSKKGDGRFLGHIDTVQEIIRDIRRSGIPIVYSGGFHPSPKVSFAPPIPLGSESLSEYFDVEIEGNLSSDNFIERMRSVQSDRFGILDAFTIPLDEPSIASSVEEERYIIAVPPHIKINQSLEEHIERFLNAGDWAAIKKTKKGEKSINLKDEIRSISLLKDGKIEMALAARNGRKIKVEDALSSILGLSEGEKKLLDILKAEMLFAGPLGDMRKARVA